MIAVKKLCGMPINRIEKSFLFDSYKITKKGNNNIKFTCFESIFTNGYELENRIILGDEKCHLSV